MPKTFVWKVMNFILESGTAKETYFCFMSPALVQSPASVASHSSASSTKPGIILLFIFYFNITYGQDTTLLKHDPYLNNNGITINHQNRIWLITGINVVGYGSSLIIFNSAWYKNYPHTSFHSIHSTTAGNGYRLIKQGMHGPLIIQAKFQLLCGDGPAYHKKNLH